MEISKECIPQTSTSRTQSIPWSNDDYKEAIIQRKQALSQFKRSPNTNNLMTSKYLELKHVEQLKFRCVSHGDLMFRKSIIKHLLKRFGIR